MNKKFFSDKTVLFISDLDFSKIGNQVLLNTVLGYIRNNFKVVLLTSAPKAENIFEGINFPEEYRDKVIIKRFCPLLRYPRMIFLTFVRFIKQFFLLNKWNKKDRSETEKKSFFTYAPQLSFLSFLPGGIFWGIVLAAKYRPQIIYGYEPLGVLPAWIISKIFSAKFITKFQGTILYSEIRKSMLKTVLNFPFHIISMLVPSDLVIMENDGTRGREVLLKLGIPERRIRFWIDGVDKNMYIPNGSKEFLLNEFSLKKESKVILTVSRLEPWKRVDRAIKIMPQVVKKVPETVLIIVGWGSEENNLRDLVKELDLEKKVIFAGKVTHNEVKYFMNGCDIFLSLYDYSNLGNPVLEALVCGKSVVTIDDGSTTDVLKNGYNAILVPKESLEQELPEVVVELLKNDERRRVIEHNARAFAEKHLLSWTERMDLEVKEVLSLLK